MIVSGGQPANFNYVAFDGTTGLFVAGLIYEVTTGSPVLVGPPVAMTDMGDGVYVGQFTPDSGESYLIISAIYDDAGFTTPSAERPPAADNFDAFTMSNSLLNFNYGTYDQNPFLTINATVFNITDIVSNSFTMTHVALGVYMGQFIGANMKQYLVEKIPTNPDYTAGADSFQTFPIFASALVQFESANLIGQSLTAILKEA